MKTANFSPKQKQTIRNIKQALMDNPKGLTLDEINQKTKLSISTIQVTLKILESEVIYNEVENAYALAERITKPLTPANDEPIIDKTTGETTKKPMLKRKPFTPNPTKGYEVKGDKVRIFLDRRNNAKSLTLSADDLEELVNAIKKALPKEQK